MRPVVHFEINGPDGKQLCDFYEKTFGWHIDWNDEMTYGLVDTHGGKGFNGGIGTDRDGGHGVIVYIGVPDLEATLKHIEELGGKTLVPVTEIPDIVTFAIFQDPHGNAVGIVKDDPSQPGPQVSPGDGIPVTWFEIMGRDASIQDFYAKVFDWKIADNAPAPGYGTVGWEEWGFGGGVGTIEGHHQPYVTIYPEVPDVDATVAKVREHGGTVMVHPTDMPEVGIRMAAFNDPQGNLIGCYKQIGTSS